MTHAATLTPLLGREFDNFLFAPLGDDLNGAPLSVVSALARLDVDPWKEALSLARMPREPAMGRLTSLIASLPKDSATGFAPEVAATRLIALLPQATRFNAAASGPRLHLLQIGFAAPRSGSAFRPRRSATSFSRRELHMRLEASPMRPRLQANPRLDVRAKRKGKAGRSHRLVMSCPSLSSPRSPSSTTRIFSLAEKCRRVARRMSLIALPAGRLPRPGFLSHLRSLRLR